jgi:hypothetical protein
MMRRQQELLLAMLQRASLPQTIFQLPSILNALGGSVQTNFPYDQVLPLAHDLMQIPVSRVRRIALDYANGSVANYGGASDLVLLPDWQHIRSTAQGIFSDQGLRTGSRVEVLNGAGVPGQAEALASWLQEAQVRIKDFASASRFDYSRTEVAIAPHASARVRATARSVATLLQAPVVSTMPPEATAPVVVIIGHDFQDLTEQ